MPWEAGRHSKAHNGTKNQGGGVTSTSNGIYVGTVELI